MMTLFQDLAGKYMSERGISVGRWDSTSQKEMLSLLNVQNVISDTEFPLIASSVELTQPEKKW